MFKIILIIATLHFVLGRFPIPIEERGRNNWRLERLKWCYMADVANTKLKNEEIDTEKIDSAGNTCGSPHLTSNDAGAVAKTLKAAKNGVFSCRNQFDNAFESYGYNWEDGIHNFIYCMTGQFDITYFNFHLINE